MEELELVAARLVGSNPIDQAQNRLKRAMLSEALGRTAGNFARAANLLGIKRQAVQQMVTRYELGEWATGLRAGRIRPL